MKSSNGEPVPIEAKQITVRPFDDHDVNLFADYLYRSSDDFLKGIGLDPSRLLAEGVFRERFLAGIRKAAAGEGPVLCLSILREGEPVGAHTLTELSHGQSAVMHAHIWSERHRGQGIARWSYLKAAEFFCAAHGLREILFRTPVTNDGPNRVKEKIGIPRTGEGMVDSAVSIPGTRAFLYRLDADLLDRLLREAGLR